MKMCWRLEETETNVAHVVSFRSCLLIPTIFQPPFLSLVRHIIFLHIYHVLRTSVSVINIQSVGPSIRSLTCCSCSLCVCFHYFSTPHGSQFCFCFSPRCCTLPIKMSNFHRVFFCSHCYRDFFSPLNIYSLSRLKESSSHSIRSCLSTHLWPANEAKGGEERQIFLNSITIAVVLVSFSFSSDPFVCSFARSHRRNCTI